MFSKPLFKFYFVRALIVAGIFAILISLDFGSYIAEINKTIEISEYLDALRITDQNEFSEILRNMEIKVYASNSDTGYYQIDSEYIIRHLIIELYDFGFSLSIIGMLAYFVRLVFSAYGKKSYSFLGILPYKKYAHYIYQYFSALMIFVLPYILCIGLCKYLESVYSVKIIEVYYPDYFDMIFQIKRILFATFLYSCFIMLSKLFGNPFYCAIFCLLFLFGCMGTLYSLDFVLGTNMYNEFELNKLITLPYLIVGIIAFFFIGMMLHNIYPIERLNNIFAYKWLNYVVYIAGGIMGGFSFYGFIAGFSNRVFNAPQIAGIVLSGIAITVFAVNKLINLIQNGGDSFEISSFVKARI